MEKDCRFKHDPEKKGTEKTKKRNIETNDKSDEPAGRQEEAVIQPEPVLQPETLDPDFIIGLIRALVPGMTSEAWRGREKQSPRRRKEVQQDREVMRSEERLTNAVKMILQSAGQAGRR